MTSILHLPRNGKQAVPIMFGTIIVESYSGLMVIYNFVRNNTLFSYFTGRSGHFQLKVKISYLLSVNFQVWASDKWIRVNFANCTYN